MKIGILLFLMGTAFGALCAGGLRPGRLDEMPRIATHLARGHGYVTPHNPSPDASPTSQIPPLYTYLMAGVYSVLGIETRASIGFMLALNAIFYGATAAGTFAIGRIVFSRVVGAIAGLATIFHPLFFIRLSYVWETFFSMAVFVWLIAWALSVTPKKYAHWRMAVMGIVLGLLVLTNTGYAAIAPAVILIATHGVRWKQRALACVVSSAAFVIVLIPWTVRNYQTAGRLYFVRSGMELEIWMGNAPGTTGWINHKNHPWLDPREGKKLRAMGEVGYYRHCGERFRADYAQDPSAYWWRTLRRVAYIFISDATDETRQRMNKSLSMVRTVLDVVGLTAGLAGLYAAWRLGYRVGWILPTAMLSQIPYVITHMNARYSMPARVLLFFPAAFLLVALWQYARTRSWPIPTTVSTI